MITDDKWDNKLPSQLTPEEAAELSNLLAEKWGVRAPPTVLEATAIGRTLEFGFSKKQSIKGFCVVLSKVGKNRISVMKELRNIRLDLGLKETKDLIENPPIYALEYVTQEQADKMVRNLEAAGATAKRILAPDPDLTVFRDMVIERYAATLTPPDEHLARVRSLLQGGGG
tara:strand:+ start:2395 stop:2907 length:513 start_codon:yes stop_codon:yes gene_type:complete